MARCAPAAEAATIRKVGHLVPSSNTVLEPLVALLGVLAGGSVSQHVGRISVRQLSLAPESLAQFERSRMVAAADLLAEAPLDAIVWNGTSGSWLGLDHDAALVEALQLATNLPATTATLAMFDAYRRFGAERVAVVCPYTADLAEAIVREYERQGVRVVAVAQLGLTSNVDMGKVSAETMRRMLAEVAGSQADAIGVVCTNLSAIQLTAAFEAEFGIPIVDSIAATFAASARLCGVPVRIDGLGRLLAG